MRKTCENHEHYVADCFPCRKAYAAYKAAGSPELAIPKLEHKPGKPFEIIEDEVLTETGEYGDLGGETGEEKAHGGNGLKGLPVEKLREMAKANGMHDVEGVPVDNVSKVKLREAMQAKGIGDNAEGDEEAGQYGPGEEKPKSKPLPEAFKPMADQLFGSPEFEKAVHESDVLGLVSKDVKRLTVANNALAKRIKEVRAMGGGTAKIVVNQTEKPVPIPTGDDIPNSPVLKRVIEHLANREHVALIGPAGSGKSTLIRLAAKALEAKVYHTPCGGDIREQHLLGRTIPIKGEWTYIPAPFVNGFESKEFAVNMLDEMDGVADPSVLLPINDVLAGFDMLHLPWRWDDPYAKRGAGFLGVAATMNTAGTGANQVYQGRSALDGSTLDRFVGCIIEVDYDHNYEQAVVDKVEDGVPFLEWTRELRKRVSEKGLRRIVSTRMVIRGAALLNRGWKLTKVKDAMLTGWSFNDKKAVA